MSLSKQYNTFYQTTLEKENLSDVTLFGWPRNRTEAVVYVKGDGNTILDVGCGNGHLLYQFRNRFENLIGLEYSAMRLKQATLNLDGYNFRPVIGTAEKLETIESDSVDRIISADTIEHIPDIYAAIAEFYRVMKPGGVLVVNTPNIAFLKKRLLLLLGRFPATSQSNEGLGNNVLFDGGHLHYFTFRSLRILLERVGFRVVKPIGYGKLGAFQNVWPSLLSGGVQWVAVKPE